MRNRILGGAAIVLALALGSATAARAETLLQAMALAYQNNPDLLSQFERLRSVNEQIAQALSGYRPDVAVSGSYGIETQRRDLPGSDWESLNPADLGITITQPLYRGGRTEASVRAAENTILATRADVTISEQQVLLDAVTAYVNYLRDDAVLRLQRNNESVLARQLQAVQDRFSVGELTRTDVDQSVASLAGATADRITAEGQLNASRANFIRVIGIEPRDLEVPSPAQGLPASLEETISIAQGNNPEVVGASYRERAAADGIDIARGALLPEINLQGDLRRSWERSFEGEEFDSASLIAQVVIPLYQAGDAESRVREARYIRNQRRIEIDSARRFSIEEAIRAWEALTSSRAAIGSQRRQIEANQSAVEGVRQEALVGSRTVLDVLDAEQDLLDSQVELVRSRRDEVVASYQLLAAVGRLTAKSLGLSVDVYDFDADYLRTRATWIGTSIPE